MKYQNPEKFYNFNVSKEKKYGKNRKTKIMAGIFLGIAGLAIYVSALGLFYSHLKKDKEKENKGLERKVEQIEISNQPIAEYPIKAAPEQYIRASPENTSSANR